jgi:predicted nucleotidyltransferase
VRDILDKYPYTFYAFGSRVKGNSKRFSDLDICFYEQIPINVLSHLDEDFEESDLPFKVDIVDGLACNENFRALIQKDLIKL